MNDKTYWENRYQKHNTGWDIGYPSPPLTAYIDELSNKEIEILIPGAGYAHEAHYLFQQGFDRVKVLDFSARALQALRQKYPEIPPEWLVQSDFFKHEGSYDLILEQTFFCALDPALRENYVNAMHSLLKKNGVLAGVFFNFERTEQGPPYGGSYQEYYELFEPLFKIHKMEACYNSIKPRAGSELFFIFEKR